MRRPPSRVHPRNDVPLNRLNQKALSLTAVTLHTKDVVTVFAQLACGLISPVNDCQPDHEADVQVVPVKRFIQRPVSVPRAVHAIFPATPVKRHDVSAVAVPAILMNPAHAVPLKRFTTTL